MGVYLERSVVDVLVVVMRLSQRPDNEDSEVEELEVENGVVVLVGATIIEERSGVVTRAV